MDWIPQDKYHSKSICGQYRVSVTNVGGQSVYTAWHRGIRDKEAVWKPIGYSMDHAAAQRACDHHARRARKGRSTIRHEESGT
jgi:hypothetical protein